MEKQSSHVKTFLESIKEWTTYGEIMYIRSRDKLSFYTLYQKECHHGTEVATGTQRLKQEKNIMTYGYFRLLEKTVDSDLFAALSRETSCSKKIWYFRMYYSLLRLCQV